MATYVLVHGAGTGGWLWDDVRHRLEAADHSVHSPSLLGVGEGWSDEHPEITLTTHIDQIVDLAYEHRLEDIVLVGFSYGGLVVAGAANRLGDRVTRVVYVDAFVPEPGLSFLDLLPDRARTAMLAGADAVGRGTQVPPAPLHLVGGVGAIEPGVSEQHVESVLDRRGFHPIGTYTEPFPAPGGAPDRPRRFVSCTHKPAADPLIMLAGRLREQGWQVDEIDTGHFVMLTMPTRLTQILLDEA